MKASHAAVSWAKPTELFVRVRRLLSHESSQIAEWEPGPVRAAAIAIVILAAIQTIRFTLPHHDPTPAILTCPRPVQLGGPTGRIVCWSAGHDSRKLASCLSDVGRNEILPGDRLLCKGSHLVIERMDPALLRHLAIPLCLNRATREDLASIDGIGPGLARRIVTFRRIHGAFATNESLLLVPGVGPSLLRRIRPRLLAPSQCGLRLPIESSVNSTTSSLDR